MSVSTLIEELEIESGRAYFLKFVVDIFYPDDFHYFIVVNKEIKPDESLLLVNATSKVDNCVRRAKKAGLPANTVVILDQGRCNFLARRSAIDCNSIHELTHEELSQMINCGEGFIKPIVESDILHEIRAGIKASKKIRNWIKGRV